MNKRILALCLIVCVCMAAFVGCKAKDKNLVGVAVTDENGVSVTDENGKTVTEMKEAQTDKNGDVVTKKVTDKNGETVTDASGKPVTEVVADDTKTTTKKGQTTSSPAKTTSKPSTSWKSNSDGTYTNGTVTASVLDNGGASVSEGEELIKQLIKGGLKDGKVISKKSTSTQVVYVASGTQTTGDSKTAKYYKFQYILEGKKSYLITYSAEKQDSLNGDFSYITDNISSLA